jgi:hypothetical protein
MPSTVVYKDGRQVFTDRQTSDWGGFIKSGSRGQVRRGHGNLYRPCRAQGFGLAPTATLTPDCRGLTTGSPDWSGFTSGPLSRNGRSPGSGTRGQSLTCARRDLNPHVLADTGT